MADSSKETIEKLKKILYDAANRLDELELDQKSVSSVSLKESDNQDKSIESDAFSSMSVWHLLGFGIMRPDKGSQDVTFTHIFPHGVEFSANSVCEALQKPTCPIGLFSYLGPSCARRGDPTKAQMAERIQALERQVSRYRALVKKYRRDFVHFLESNQPHSSESSDPESDGSKDEPYVTPRSEEKAWESISEQEDLDSVDNVELNKDITSKLKRKREAE